MKSAFLVLPPLLAVCSAATGAPPAAAEASQRCEKEVREYVQAMQFIRAAAGANIGDRVAAGIASEEHIRKVAQEQGYCAAAQVVRERSAKR